MAHQCPDCDMECSTPQALGSHRRYRHPPESGGDGGDGENRRALEVTLAEMTRLGRFEDIDAATVQTLRSLADAVDRWPDEAQLWRQYREALTEVMKADDEADDSLTAALADIRSAT